MSVDVVFTDDDRGVHIVYSGVIDGPALIDIISRVFADPKFPGLAYWLGDFAAVTEMNVTASHVRQIVDNSEPYAHLNPNLHLALVSPKVDFYGIMRMYEMQTKIDEDGGFGQTRVFETMDEAKAWLLEFNPDYIFC